MANKRKTNIVASTPKRRAKKYSAREATILCSADPYSSPDSSPIRPPSNIESPPRSPTPPPSPERLHEEPVTTTNALLGRILEVLLRLEEKLIIDDVQPIPVRLPQNPAPEQPPAAEQRPRYHPAPEQPPQQPPAPEQPPPQPHAPEQPPRQPPAPEQPPQQHPAPVQPPQQPPDHEQQPPAPELQPQQLPVLEQPQQPLVPERPLQLERHVLDHQVQPAGDRIPLLEISEERIRKLRSTSYKPSSFAIALSREYYTEAERLNNCCLRGRRGGEATIEIPSISPAGRRLKRIFDTTFRAFGTPDGDKGSTRRQIITAIDSANRYGRKKK